MSEVLGLSAVAVYVDCVETSEHVLASVEVLVHKVDLLPLALVYVLAVFVLAVVILCW